MRMKTIILPSLLGLALIPAIGANQELTAQEKLGELIFNDVKLSLYENQSCATCHAPGSGWTGDIPAINSPFANQKTTIVNFAVWHGVLPDQVVAGWSFERWKGFVSYTVALSQSGL